MREMSYVGLNQESTEGWNSHKVKQMLKEISH